MVYQGGSEGDGKREFNYGERGISDEKRNIWDR